MVKRKSIDDHIIHIAKKYAHYIKDQGISVEKLILFGSCVHGDQKSASDIDLCVVSPQFGKDEISELQYLLKMTREVDDKIEPFPVSSGDYVKEVTPLITEVKTNGYVIPLN